jgi:chemotaxis protein MotB
VLPGREGRRTPGRKHGGAWKVAYADFVTALMALFIVLWMMNSSSTVKHPTCGYVRDAKGYSKALGAGPANSGEGLRVDRSSVAQMRQQVEAALRTIPDFQKLREHVQVSVTGEGLRIDLMETEGGMFFVQGSPAPTDAGAQLLRALATELGRMPNRIAIEGHTDARPFRDVGGASMYGNWELSVDRANAARRLLYEYGIREPRVMEVRGYADQHLLNAREPNDPRNRRVSLVVKF